MPTVKLNGPTPKALDNRRSVLGDALLFQKLIVECAQLKPKDPVALSSLGRVFVALAPLVCALRGRPLMLHGSITKRLDMTPKEAAKQLKQLKALNIAAIEDAPETTKTEDEPNVKGIS